MNRWFDPEKASAHRKVGYAIRKGHLQRQPCEVCGAFPTHGHHEDYSKPLDVRWLCPGHHNLIGECCSGRNARKTHCDHGHPFDEANTYYRRNGGRMCRECNRLRNLDYRLRKAAA